MDMATERGQFSPQQHSDRLQINTTHIHTHAVPFYHPAHKNKLQLLPLHLLHWWQTAGSFWYRCVFRVWRGSRRLVTPHTGSPWASMWLGPEVWRFVLVWKRGCGRNVVIWKSSGNKHLLVIVVQTWLILGEQKEFAAIFELPYFRLFFRHMQKICIFSE